ncbi:transcriptional regulator [Prevotella sp. PINT]|jgi:hypothetical protein|uniref:DUF6377 domain-containing protein n=1 Tax=Palleniella intestinalis TaxID=2736291 RepID=UPI001552EBAD|nr:DUF6377 domain-containing protein [Palleniella intestinalis]NPD81502.1 transcriptional regulator [Palleniella intestinalis]
METLKRLVFFIIVLLCSALSAAGRNVDSVLVELDGVLLKWPDYVEQHEEKISELRKELARAKDDKLRSECLYELFEKYKSYQNDSALVYIEKCAELAGKMGDKAREGECLALLAYQCASTGMYAEADLILSRINVDELEGVGQKKYYMTATYLYSEMAFYTQVPALRSVYGRKSKEANEKMQEAFANSLFDDFFLQCKEIKMYNQHKVAEGLKINDERLSQIRTDSREFAIIAFYRYIGYKSKGDIEKAKYWLAKSAVADVKHAVRDQGAMWELANLLMAEGDISRSYRYISYAWDCANKYGTKMRSWQIAPVLSTVDKNYQDELDSTNSKLTLSIVLVSVMSLLFLAMLFYVMRQRNSLRQARNELDEKNKKLSEVVGQLREANDRLSSVNLKMGSANVQLNESNRAKEMYLGIFLRQCSLYIDKFETFRKRLEKLAKNREFDDLYKLVRSDNFKAHELEQLYESFDKTFLHLYPDFVEQFNSLLREEERIILPEEGKLNTVIRIFALIRLGIEDSSKIAKFLHYSVNTIYNYRARIKNGAIADRENFEKHVKEIGTGA